MEKKPVILIAPRTGEYRGLPTQFIFSGHSDAIICAGGFSFTPNLPILSSTVPLSSTENKKEFLKLFSSYESFIYQMYTQADGVLIVGGTDCNPALYGEMKQPGTQTPENEKDVTDFLLIHYALSEGKPLLAICAGSQRFNVFHGGTLYQDIFTDKTFEGKELCAHNEKEKRTSFVHNVEVVDSHPVVAKMFGNKGSVFGVNSTHKQAVKKLGDGLEVILRSSDGIVEGTMRPDLPFAVALQYHPEALHRIPGQENHLAPYIALVDAARAYAQ